MALLWFDGFETYNAVADIDVVVQNIFSDFYFYGCGIQTADGRRGGGCLNLGNGHHTEWTLANNYQSLVIGFAVRNTGNNPRTGQYGGFNIYDGGTIQLTVALNRDEIEIYRGTGWSGGTLLGTSSGANYRYYPWNYFEIKFTIDSSAGAVEVRLNNQSVLSLSGVNTQQSANAYMNKIQFGNWAASSTNTYYDDLYICDLTGTKNNDFLGDIRIDALRVTGAGSHTDFSPLSGNNYENVDESPAPDDDSSYNSGSNVADQDSYDIQQLSDKSPVVAGTTIIGVKSQITVKKTDATGRGVKVLTRSGGSDYLSDEYTLTTSYATPAIVYEDNPDDSADWEDADVNALEVGIEITT